MNRAMTGVYGELYTGRYLRDNGYSIVTANYRCRFGEIDIIASDKNYIAFVEVKTRDVGFVVSGKEAVDYGKRKRILATSKVFLSKNSFDLQPRFDVAEVYMENGEVSSFNYIKNAYQEEEK